MDPTILTAAIIAGATTLSTEAAKIVGTEVVKEATKDAYRALKSKMGTVLGRRAERAIDKIEASPTDEAARSDLIALVQSLPVEDAPEVEPNLHALLSAFKSDPAVKPIVEIVARIKLDVDAGGHVAIEFLEGAREIDVKAKAGGDFVFRGVKMDTGSDAGN